MVMCALFAVSVRHVVHMVVACGGHGVRAVRLPGLTHTNVVP